METVGNISISLGDHLLVVNRFLPLDGEDVVDHNCWTFNMIRERETKMFWHSDQIQSLFDELLVGVVVNQVNEIRISRKG